MKLHEKIESYLTSRIARQHRPAFLSVNPQSQLIQNGGGDLAAYELESAVPGSNLFDSCPYLIGLTDQESGPQVFECLSISTRIPPVDLHIVPQADELLVIFMITARPVQSFNELQQKLNEATLDLESARRPDAAGDPKIFLPTDVSSQDSLLDLFLGANAFLLERISPKRFVRLLPPPEWVRQWYPDLADDETEVNPAEAIPFLEFFLEDAEAFWATGGITKFASEFWEESSANNKTLYFSAKALCLGKRQILIIQPAGGDFLEKMDLLQKARRAALNHRALQQETLKKEVLLHCIIHDLKNPLTSIMSAFTLLGHEQDPEAFREILALGSMQADKQRTLIDEILVAFSGEIKSWTPADSQVPCANDISHATFNALRASFTLAGVDLVLQFPNDNPHTRCPVHADPGALDRILCNVLENALRHSPPKSTVTISIQPDQDHTVICIEDEGPGVPLESRSTIFEQFNQGPNASKGGSSGLGLFFCKMTLKKWGGDIECYQAPNKAGGAGFRIILKTHPAKPTINANGHPATAQVASHR